ncbi:Splicing factor U2AF [Carpediemonas membranifera]|uniref:Splicing factor U2AF n=1 Tax=Carpediemonas membranifera TaxID=201153 RepID=A0A8J6AYT6_9EUKA|nr:Splicing factor U2AF [Carpediemonas membranifera]|eukprot:KAG9395705.1 Splicing factor U2AF [Carpediemonas membranifera]
MRLVDDSELADAIEELAPDKAREYRANYEIKNYREMADIWASQWQRRELPKGACPYHRHTAGCYHCALADATLFAAKVWGMMLKKMSTPDLESAMGNAFNSMYDTVRDAGIRDDLCGGNGVAYRRETFNIFGGHPYGNSRDLSREEGDRILVVPDNDHCYGIGFGFSEVIKGMKGILLAPTTVMERGVTTRVPIWSIHENTTHIQRLTLQGRAGRAVTRDEDIVTIAMVYSWWPSREDTAHQGQPGVHDLAESVRREEKAIANVRAPPGYSATIRAAFIPRDWGCIRVREAGTTLGRMKKVGTRMVSTTIPPEDNCKITQRPTVKYIPSRDGKEERPYTVDYSDMGIEGSIRRLTEMIGTPVGPVGRDDLYTNNRRADGTLRDEREPRNNGVHRCDRERRDVRPHHEDRERRDDGPRREVRGRWEDGPHHEDRERRDDQGRDSGESRRRSPPHGTGKRSGKDRAVSYTGAGKRGKLDGDARYEAGSRQSSDSDAERDELRKELDEAKKLILALRARDSREGGAGDANPSTG